MSDFCGREARSLVERFTPRRASAGSECEVIHAGTMPKMSPVSNDKCECEGEDCQRGAGVDWQVWRVGEGEGQNHPGAAVGKGDADEASSAAQQKAFDQHLADKAERAAPKAMLMEVSARRVVPFASRRFAMLAQATRRTRPEIPINR